MKGIAAEAVLPSLLRTPYELLFRREMWNIGIAYEPITSFLQVNQKPKIHWFPERRIGKYLSDPFGLATKHGICIMCEEFDYATSKGRIVSIDLSETGTISEPRPTIELSVHASYPYVFEYDGDVYCVPETYKAREICLYKSEEFPVKWKKAASLVRDFPGVDTTVFQYEGRWWLTCSDGEAGPYDKLYAWYAESILGPWEPHGSNPVKRDIGSSRPAGTPFFYKGDLYRPAQDCSTTYGRRVALNRVISLTPARFEEEPVAFIEPYGKGPYPHGLHTVASVGKITIVDGKRFMKPHEACQTHIMRRRSRLAERSR